MLKGTTQTSTALTGAQTTGINSNSTDVGNYNGVVAYLNVTAVSGTTPSMTVKLQDSPDKVTWYDIPGAAFTAMTAIGTQRISALNVGTYVRAVTSISGTTPSFTATVQFAGIN